jgi:hypothetical protein
LFKFQKKSNLESVQILKLFKFENSSIPKICSNSKNEKNENEKQKLETDENRASNTKTGLNPTGIFQKVPETGKNQKSWNSYRAGPFRRERLKRCAST